MSRQNYFRELLSTTSRRTGRKVRRNSNANSELLESRQLLTLLISEVNADPLFGDNDTDQYFELRGEPGSTIEDGTYFVLVDGDFSRQGEIHTFFDVSGLEIGSNGFLVVSQQGNGYEVHPDANHVQSTAEGFGGLPDGIYHDESALSDRFDFIFGSNSFLLIQSDTEPSLDDDIDANNDGTTGGVFDNWTVLDSVSILQASDDAIGYGNLIFTQGQGTTPDGATVIETDKGADYMARIGNSTGSTHEDWVAGNVDEDSGADDSFFRFTHGTFGNATHIEYSGRGTNHVGSSNFLGNISGTVFGDLNNNGEFDSGESGVAGVELFADRNGNGIQDDVTFIVEPDDYELQAELTNVAPGVSFTIAGGADHGPLGFALRPQIATVPGASTGEYVFAHEGVNFMSWIRQIRMDFDKPAKAVSIDTIGDSDLKLTYGRIEAFDVDGNSLGIVRSSPLAQNSVERITFESDTANIAYAVLHSDDEFMESSPFGRFDNLSYVLPEESTVTDENGHYEFEQLAFGTYDIHAISTDSATITSPAAGFHTREITLNEQHTANFGVRRVVDVSVTKTDGLPEAAPGETLSYTVTVNGDERWDLEEVSVADVLPEGLENTTLVEVVLNGGATSTLSNGMALAGQFNDTIALPMGSSVVYTVNGDVKNDYVGTLINTAELGLPEGTEDTNTENNSATDETLIPEVTLGISTTGEVFGENGGSTQVVVTRDGTSRGDLIITLTPSDDTIISVPEEVTILDGDSSVSFELTILDNDYVSGDQTVSVDANAVFGVDLPEESLTLTIEDDEIAGISVTPAEATVDETGTTAAAMVVLDEKPAGDVVLRISGGDFTEVVLDQSQLTFTSENWNTPQEIIATGQDDEIVDGDQTAAFEISVDPTFSDEHYLDAPASIFEVVNEDDETPGFTISQEGGETVISETGTTGSVSVVLDGEPDSNVILNIGGGDSSEVQLGIEALTFTTLNWNIPQSISFTGIDDETVDGDVAVLFEVSVDPASSEIFQELEAQNFEVINEDDDEAGVDVSITGTTVGEDGGDVILNIVLTAQPKNQVVFDISDEGSDEVQLSATSISFTAETWDEPQEIVISGVDDDLADGDQASLITVSINTTQSDAAFHELPDSAVEVTTADDDVAGISISESGDSTTTSEDGLSDSVFVVLDAQPSSAVVLTASFNEAEIAVSLPLLTFTPNSWNTPREITISSVDEFVMDGDQIESLLLTVNAEFSAPEFADAADSVFVNSLDNDAIAIVVNESEGSTIVAENGASDEVEVSLGAMPDETVVVQIASGESLETGSDSLTFSPFDWNTPQLVAVDATDNNVAAGDGSGSLIFSVDAENSDPVWAGVESVTVIVTIGDDDVAGLEIAESDGGTTATEGDVSDSVVVTLNSEPTGMVVFEINVEGDDLTVAPETVTITPENWNLPVEVTIDAVDDETVDGDQTSRLTISVADATTADEFQNLPDQFFDVVTIDNDVAAFEVTETDGNTTVSEDGTTDSFSVRLSARPVSSVVFDVTADNDQVTPAQSALTFTPENWDTPQTIEVQAVDDTLEEEPTVTNFTVTINTSESDSAFVDLESQAIIVTTEDNDEPQGQLDIDGDGSAQALSDGILAIRYLASFTGTNLTGGAANEEGVRHLPNQVVAWLDPLRTELLDVDGDSQSLALTDGILILRYLAGFRGDILTTGAVSEQGSRTAPEEVVAHLDRFFPPANGNGGGGGAAMAAATRSSETLVFENTTPVIENQIASSQDSTFIGPVPAGRIDITNSDSVPFYGPQPLPRDTDDFFATEIADSLLD